MNLPAAAELRGIFGANTVCAGHGKANDLYGLGRLPVSLITLWARHAFIPVASHGVFCKVLDKIADGFMKPHEGAGGL